MRKEYIQSAKTELERLQKQDNTAANSTLSSNQPTTGTRASTRPFLRLFTFRYLKTYKKMIYYFRQIKEFYENERY